LEWWKQELLVWDRNEEEDFSQVQEEEQDPRASLFLLDEGVEE
jgi:hypothetical protein